MVGIVLSAPRVEEVAVSTALYRRYRPETFAEVIGQEHVTEPLMVALEKNRVNHAYLFSGPRGCGKTTSARILARCLNCAQGPTPTPCGVCDSCRELSRDGGGSLDVIEMDAASHGGVDHARDLRERATLAPVRDRYKIFIIDEAHMVTREGFNALLKIVEEPPEHVKFIFATTEPNKVLGTIRSRTHHYPFRLVPPEVLLPFLQGLCDQEQVAVEPGVLQLVIRAGGGSVRDSLSILDQLMAGASSQNGIEYDRAVALLGYTHAQLLDEVIEALGAKDAPTLFGAVSRVVATGQDPRRFVEDLLERLRDLIVVKAVPQAAGQILQGVPQDQLERLAQQAQALGERELTVAAGTVNETLNGMTGAANPQLQLELLCARLLLPAVEGSAGGAEVAALASRLQVLERRVASGAAGSGPAQGGMSAARAAGMAAAGLAPKTQAPNAQTPSASVQEATAPQSAPQQSGSQPGSSQHASAGAPPLAGAPLSAAPLAPAAQESAPAAGAPLAGNAPATPDTPASSVADAAAAGAPSAPLKLDPNDPLAAVQGNWRAILNRMSVPGAADQLMKVRPARMDGATLYVSADIATLRAVKGFVPELTARVSEFLRRQVTIHAQVAKPGEQVKPAAQPAAQPAAPSAPTAQPAVPATVAPQAPQQPVQQTPPQPAQPAPLADGPRGGEDAWRRHGQPLTGANTPESTSVDAPLGAWEVAPIPQSAPEEAPQQAAQAAVQAPVQEAPAGPLAPEPPVAPVAQQVPTAPVAQQVPTAPAGGFGERDSFAASGSGVPQQESATEPQYAQEPQHAPDSQYAQETPFAQEPPHAEEPPYEEEPPFEDEPAYAEPVEAPAAAAIPAEPVAPAGPLAAPVAPAGPLAAAGPLAEAPQAAPADTAPASDEKPAAQASNAPATPTPNAPTPSAPAAPARPARAASDEDYVSEDDEKVENSTFIGLRAIEKIIGGTVIDERPLHQP